MARDPVFQNSDDGKWYFWDETWSDRHGPFVDEIKARDALEDYSLFLNQNPKSKQEAEDIQIVKNKLIQIQAVAFADGFRVGLEEQKSRHFHMGTNTRLDVSAEEYYTKYRGRIK